MTANFFFSITNAQSFDLMTFHDIFVTFPLICWLSGELEEGPGRWALAANLYNARLVQHDILQEE